MFYNSIIRHVCGVKFFVSLLLIHRLFERENHRYRTIGLYILFNRKKHGVGLTVSRSTFRESFIKIIFVGDLLEKCLIFTVYTKYFDKARLALPSERHAEAVSM